MKWLNFRIDDGLSPFNVPMNAATVSELVFHGQTSQVGKSVSTSFALQHNDIFRSNQGADSALQVKAQLKMNQLFDAWALWIQEPLPLLKLS